MKLGKSSFQLLKLFLSWPSNHGALEFSVQDEIEDWGFPPGDQRPISTMVDKAHRHGWMLRIPFPEGRNMQIALFGDDPYRVLCKSLLYRLILLDGHRGSQGEGT